MTPPLAVAWPDRRADVIDGLVMLADEVPALSDTGVDPRAWNLTSAVHALVDDTWWDVEHPSGWIGLTLRNQDEADALHRVAMLIVEVSERQRALGTDRAWFEDRAWPDVRRSAAAALDVMLGSDRL